MKKKFLFGKTWFIESFKPGEPQTSTWGVMIEKEIYSGKSKYQKIEVFATKEYGRILALDGLVQLSTKDEAVYHEMLVHSALFYHPKPQSILIIGGGDGGALREVARHPVKEISLVDIDKKVIEISKKYLPSVSKGAFEDRRLKIFHEDGSKFVKRYRSWFDIVIIDLTDYFGPSKKLGEVKFLNDVSLALKKNGIISAQTAYLKENFAKRVRKNIRKVFPFFKVHKAFVGCFPFDEHTFSFGSKNINFNKISFKKIKENYKRIASESRKQFGEFKYYSPEIHFASQVLPKYLK